MCVPPDQIEEREQKDPDDVDEVPIEPCDGDRRVVPFGIGALPCSQTDAAEHGDADRDMHRVQRRRDEVESKEQRNCASLWPAEVEGQAGNEVLLVFAAILDSLEHQEQHPVHRAEDVDRCLVHVAGDFGDILGAEVLALHQELECVGGGVGVAAGGVPFEGGFFGGPAGAEAVGEARWVGVAGHAGGEALFAFENTGCALEAVAGEIHAQQIGDEGMMQLVEQHNLIVGAVLKQHRGHQVKHTGDGVMAVFPRVVDGVTAAAEIQRQIAEFNAVTQGALLKIRIGLSDGNPIRKDDDYFGTVVQTAARVCPVAGTGEVAMPEAMAQLPGCDRFTYSEQILVPLKGFSAPQPVRKLLWSAGSAPAPQQARTPEPAEAG